MAIEKEGPSPRPALKYHRHGTWDMIDVPVSVRSAIIRNDYDVNRTPYSSATQLLFQAKPPVRHPAISEVCSKFETLSKRNSSNTEPEASNNMFLGKVKRNPQNIHFKRTSFQVKNEVLPPPPPPPPPPFRDVLPKQTHAKTASHTSFPESSSNVADSDIGSELVARPDADHASESECSAGPGNAPPADWIESEIGGLGDALDAPAAIQTSPEFVDEQAKRIDALDSFSDFPERSSPMKDDNADNADVLTVEELEPFDFYSVDDDDNDVTLVPINESDPAASDGALTSLLQSTALSEANNSIRTESHEHSVSEHEHSENDAQPTISEIFRTQAAAETSDSSVSEANRRSRHLDLSEPSIGSLPDPDDDILNEALKSLSLNFVSDAESDDVPARSAVQDSTDRLTQSRNVAFSSGVSHEALPTDPRLDMFEYPLIKHGRRGRRRRIYLTVDMGAGIIRWGNGHRWLQIEDILQVRSGKQTAVLKRRSAEDVDGRLCISLITRNRSLDLECKTVEERKTVQFTVMNQIIGYLRHHSVRAGWVQPRQRPQ